MNVDGLIQVTLVSIHGKERKMDLKAMVKLRKVEKGLENKKGWKGNC